MADEIKRVIEVDTSASHRTVRQLKQDIDDLTAALSKLDKGSAEYMQTQVQLQTQQQTYADTMRMGTQETTAEIKGMEELRASIERIAGDRQTLIQQMVAEQHQIDLLTAQRKAVKKEYEEEIKITNDVLAVKDKYLKKLEQITSAELTYKTSLAETRQALKVTEKEVQAAQGSYDQMSQTLGRMRDAYRQMSAAQRKSAEGTEFLAQINALDTEVKKIDADMGNYQRNVGNYPQILNQIIPKQAQFILQLSQSAKQAGGAKALFATMTSGIKAATKAALAFVLTPIGATITSIAIAGGVLAKNWDKVTAAFGYVNPAKNAKEALDRLDKTIESLNNRLQGDNNYLLQQYTMDLEDAAGNADEAAAAQKRYNEAVEDNTIKTLQQKYAAANIAMQEAAENLNKGRKKDREEADKNYEESVKKARDLESELKRAENQRAQRIQKEKEDSIKAEEEKTAAAKKSAQEAAKARAEAIKKQQEAEAKVIEETQALIQQNRAETQENELLTLQETYDKELSAFNKRVEQEKISEETANAYRLALREQFEADSLEIEEQWKQVREDQKAEEQNAAAQEYQNRLAQLDQDAELRRLQAEATITDKEELNKKLFDLDQEQYKAQADIFREALKDDKLTEKEREKLAKQLTKVELSALKQQKEANQEANENERAEAERSKNFKLNAAKSVLNGLTSIIGEQTAVGKAAAIASATIDTYQAAASALATVPFPANIAAVSGVIAAGIAQVKQILAVDTSGIKDGNVSLGAGIASAPSIAAAAPVVSAPAVINEVPITRTLTGASEEERLNKPSEPQRVYLVYSDVEAAGNRVRVTENEATF